MYYRGELLFNVIRRSNKEYLQSLFMACAAHSYGDYYSLARPCEQVRIFIPLKVFLDFRSDYEGRRKLKSENQDLEATERQLQTFIELQK